MKHYTENHEWVEATGSGNIRVGITDFAQEQLGDVVAVDLPSVGQEIGKSNACAAVESVKAASDIYAPADGKVTAVNETLADNPALINESPLTDGWLWEMQANVNVDDLMDEAAYKTFTESGS